MKKDVSNHKDMLAKSENERDQLHIHIKTTSVRISEEQSKNTDYQTELINENAELKKEILRMKEEFQVKLDE